MYVWKNKESIELTIDTKSIVHVFSLYLQWQELSNDERVCS